MDDDSELVRWFLFCTVLKRLKINLCNYLSVCGGFGRVFECLATTWAGDFSFALASSVLKWTVVLIYLSGDFHNILKCLINERRLRAWRGRDTPAKQPPDRSFGTLDQNEASLHFPQICLLVLHLLTLFISIFLTLVHLSLSVHYPLLYFHLFVFFPCRRPSGNMLVSCCCCARCGESAEFDRDVCPAAMLTGQEGDCRGERGGCYQSR